MLASLNDPYTKFLDPKEFAEETSSIKGSLKGIGVQIGLREGKLVIIAPIEEKKEKKAGLLAEDEILEIDGKSKFECQCEIPTKSSRKRICKNVLKRVICLAFFIEKYYRKIKENK